MTTNDRNNEITFYNAKKKQIIIITDTDGDKITKKHKRNEQTIININTICFSIDSIGWTFEHRCGTSNLPG